MAKERLSRREFLKLSGISAAAIIFGSHNPIQFEEKEQTSKVNSTVSPTQEKPINTLKINQLKENNQPFNQLITNISQLDPRWATVSINGLPFSKVGCGETALAMIFSAAGYKEYSNPLKVWEDIREIAEEDGWEYAGYLSLSEIEKFLTDREFSFNEDRQSFQNFLTKSVYEKGYVGWLWVDTSLGEHYTLVTDYYPKTMTITLEDPYYGHTICQNKKQSLKCRSLQNKGFELEILAQFTVAPPKYRQRNHPDILK